MIGMIEAGVVELAPLENLVEAVGQILLGLKQILTVLATEVFSAPVLPILVWSLFWLFAVDWTRLRQIILKGGWLGVVLVGVVLVIIWQQVVPEAEVVLGLEVNGYIEKNRTAGSYEPGSWSRSSRDLGPVALSANRLDVSPVEVIETSRWSSGRQLLMRSAHSIKTTPGPVSHSSGPRSRNSVSDVSR